MDRVDNCEGHLAFRGTNEARDCILEQTAQTSSGAQQAGTSITSSCSGRRVKLSDHSPAFNDEVTNVWSLAPLYLSSVSTICLNLELINCNDTA
jgi:hypothetical protein